MPSTLLYGNFAKAGDRPKTRFLKQPHRRIIDKSEDLPDLPVRRMYEAQRHPGSTILVLTKIRREVGEGFWEIVREALFGYKDEVTIRVRLHPVDILAQLFKACGAMSAQNFSDYLTRLKSDIRNSRTRNDRSSIGG